MQLQRSPSHPLFDLAALAYSLLGPDHSGVPGWNTGGRELG